MLGRAHSRFRILQVQGNEGVPHFWRVSAALNYKAMPMWRLAGCMAVLRAMFVAKLTASSAGPPLQQPSVVTDRLRLNATCGDWTAWLPLRVNPAIVFQIISTEYADVERNFIALMEINSRLSRDNMYLMCLDTQTVVLFETMNINCVYVAGIHAHRHHDIWRLRIKVTACLLAAGFDVIASDADALWIHDPMTEMESAAHNESSIVASRGHFPFPLGRKWGSTMCMGFALFRASGMGMEVWQQVMQRIGDEIGDDQIALNNAADELGIVWDSYSDMRFEASTGVGRGVVPSLTTTTGVNFTVTLLPHSRYTRKCSTTPISNETVVAHCVARKNAGAKTSWMQESNLWYVNDSYRG